MTKKDIIQYCLTFPSAYEDYPFDDVTTVLRHLSNKKMFALISEKDDEVYIAVKCDPLKAEILRSTYKSVTPGYHFNKKHWNTIAVNGDAPKQEIHDWINDSFNLTKPKTKKVKPNDTV